jgi:septum formation protein
MYLNPQVTQTSSLADTIVLTQAENTSLGSYATAGSRMPSSDGQEILEKPADAEDNLRMLLDLNGRVCEVVTGVSVVYPILSAPGYEIK